MLPCSRVAPGTQVHHEGTTYDAESRLPTDVPDDLVQFWLNAGWIEAA
jgi:hypothetical protein